MDNLIKDISNMIDPNVSVESIRKCYSDIDEETFFLYYKAAERMKEIKPWTRSNKRIEVESK